MKRALWRLLAVSVGCAIGLSLRAGAPTHLMTDLAEHTDRVWIEGYLSQLPLEQVGKTIERAEFAAVSSRCPQFSWQVNDTRAGVMQTAYHIQVASLPDKFAVDSVDLWDSGEQAGNHSVAVAYAGKELQPATVYYWRVRTYNNNESQPWSAVKAFRTADRLEAYKTPAYPLEKKDQLPRTVNCLADGLVFADFAQAAFGQLNFTLFSSQGGDTVTVRLGECLKEGRIDRNPGGARRFLSLRVPLLPGVHTYKVKIPADRRNTADRAVLMPDYIGEVYPFRYCEVEGERVKEGMGVISRQCVSYPFNRSAASFTSSDTTLNQIWDLCKYSIEATSFAGIYVDGDRERIPYEADALINQLCHYGVDREFTLARRSHEYLLMNATWPTEWIMQSVQIAWYDYLYTGDLRSVKQYYALLKNRTLQALADPQGFISVTKDKQTPALHASINLKNQTLQNIVDWPHSGILGLGKAEGGEADGYVFTDVNTVANAYHYDALRLMASLSDAVNEPAEADTFRRQAALLYRNFNRELFDSKRGAYCDGIGTDHQSLHANLFPLAFGLVEQKNIPAVIRFVKSRGMACSVYGSQFLLDALYNAQEADYALSLLTSDAERSWYNMIRVGSTVSLEAWDNKYKPNQDWNHAWGAAPANLIPRKLMGVEPMETGFSRVRIRPQPGTLQQADLRIPTIRGEVGVAFENNPDTFTLTVDIPANMQADIYVPLSTEVKRYVLTVNGEEYTKALREGCFLKLSSGSGHYVIALDKLN